MDQAALSQSKLSRQWDRLTGRLELYPEFYEFVVNATQLTGLRLDSDLVDVGCGNGRLLEQLVSRGFHRLTGVDFSEQAVRVTSQRVPMATTFVHNIIERPLPTRYDAIFLTEVIEHVSDPFAALRNLAESLAPGGVLYISFPNRKAYLPLLYLRWLRRFTPWSTRLHHWVTWFTTPYEMRSDQPLDHAYAPRDVEAFISESGLKIVGRRGMRLLPMFHIPGLKLTEVLLAHLERLSSRVPYHDWYYRYMFICRV